MEQETVGVPGLWCPMCDVCEREGKGEQVKCRGTCTRGYMVNFGFLLCVQVVRSSVHMGT